MTASRYLCCLIAAIAIVNVAAATTLQSITNRGVLRACLAPIDPALVRITPEQCQSDCEFSGLVVDQVRAFANTLPGVELQLIEVGWAEQFENNEGIVEKATSYTPRLLQNGTCDIYVSNLSQLPWRGTKVSIVPLFQNRMIVMIKPQNVAEFPDLRALAGKTASIEEQSSFHTWLIERNAADFNDSPITVQLAGSNAPFDQVVSGDIDFTITDADIAVFAMKSRPALLTPAFAVGPIQQLGWGVEIGATQLQESIANFFHHQRADVNSPLNKAWIAHLGITINEFESLVQSLPATEQ